MAVAKDFRLVTKLPYRTAEYLIGCGTGQQNVHVDLAIDCRIFTWLR